MVEQIKAIMDHIPDNHQARMGLEYPTHIRLYLVLISTPNAVEVTPEGIKLLKELQKIAQYWHELIRFSGNTYPGYIAEAVFQKFYREIYTNRKV